MFRNAIEAEKWMPYIGALEQDASPMTEQEWCEIILEDADREGEQVDEEIISAILDNLKDDGFVCEGR